MSDVDIYRRKGDELLRRATAATDAAERSRLIGEATRWHMLAVQAEEAGRTGEPREAETVIPPAEDPSEPEPT